MRVLSKWRGAANRLALIRWGICLGLLALALLWSLPHWEGHNGDHAYYTAMALQYAGVGYDASLSQVASYFDYPAWERGLDLGFLNPTVAPLIYPRPLYPLLAALPVKILGPGGVFVPGILAGLVTVAAVLLVCRRRGTGFAGVLVIIVLLASRLFTEIGFGIYVDALVMAGVASMLLLLPWQGRTTPWHVVGTCAVVALILLSRQVPLVTVGIVSAGWLWAAIGSRRIRNAWLPHALGVGVTTVVVYVGLSRWAPYDPLPFLRIQAGAQTRGELLAAMPRLVGEGLQAAATNVVTADKILIPFVALFLVGLWKGRRTTMAGVAVAVFAACLATLALNNLGNIRYLTPMLPVAAVLAADALHPVLQRISWLRSAEAATDVDRTADADETPAPAPTPAGPRAVAVGLSAAVALVLVGTVLVNRPASLEGAPERAVKAMKGKPWPLSVRRGTLTCAGDNLEVWFIAPDGRKYAVSGTAMASSFRTPRIIELARGPVPYGWSVKPLLDQGVRLCRRAQGPPRR